MRGRPHSALLPVTTGLLLATLLAVAALGPAPAHADDIEGAGNFEVSEDPALYKLRALDRIAPFEDLAPLWDHRDASLQANVEAALARLELDDDVALKHLAVVLVDVTEIDEPKVASVNGDVMMYAASLPKIAVLLAVFEHVAQGKMELDDETKELLEDMIRESSNSATTELMHRVGKQNIAIHCGLDPLRRCNQFPPTVCERVFELLHDLDATLSRLALFVDPAITVCHLRFIVIEPWRLLCHCEYPVQSVARSYSCATIGRT